MEEIVSKNKKSIVVYTALFGDYDHLIEPRKAYHGCDFICFTDQKDLQTEIWQIVEVEQTFHSPTVANRHFKWLPHRYLQKYETSLYIDSNIVLYTDPTKLIEKYLTKADIAIPRHPFRSCLYDEALACLRENKVVPKQIQTQLKHYMHSGFPKANGLTEQNIILRHHNKLDIVRCMEQFWTELQKWGNFRDQIAFSYVVWRENIKVALMDEILRNNREFIYVPHKKKQQSVLRRIVVGITLRKRRIVDAFFLGRVLRRVAKTKN